MRLRYLCIPDLPPLKDVSITFGHEPVLGRQCTIHFIVGVNGTGKSRLLRAIAEIFLALKQADLPSFPVTIAYDLGHNLPGQESSQAVSTIYYHYGGYGRSSAYMVVLDHIPLHANVDWEQFHKLPWESQSAIETYRKRRYLQGDILLEVSSYLPTTVLAYTSGSAQEWERTFTPASPGIEERLDLQFPRVEQDPQERRQTERPPYWNTAAEAKYQQQQQDPTNDTPPPTRVGTGLAPVRPAPVRPAPVRPAPIRSPRNIGTFIQPQTLKLVVCAVALTQMLDELGPQPTEEQRQKLERQIEEATIGIINKSTFRTMFWQTNPLKVCPSCDGPRTDSPYEIDHFLPKSLYPFLSIHPTNLVPICIKCNSREKRTKDPLDHTLPDPLMHTFHPFGRPALTEIKIKVYRESSTECRVKIEEKDGSISKRIKKLNTIFNLESRWEDILKDTIDNLILSMQGQAERKKAKGVSAEDIVEDVLQTILDAETKKIGQEPHYIIRSRYANYALNDPDEKAIFLDIVRQELGIN